MSEIPERAAWLDHPVVWVDDISLFEVERLGIGDVVLSEGQVSMGVNPNRDTAEILIKSIEVVGVNHESQKLVYRVTAETRFTQPWDIGGVNLASASEREQTIF